jgi:hypothetical protein
MSKEIWDALTAIVDGFEGKVEHGFIIVENPDATPEALALGGIDPILVIDANILRGLLDPR